MRYSQLFIPTLKETPKDAELISHKLMLRAGMIRKLASGIYSIMPLGLIVLRKAEEIIREEMNLAGAQELLMPAAQPAELWKESGRWDEYGKELLRMKDRHDREFCFGPTHEEVITDIVRKEIRSYRQLPLILYQIQVKFRDEIRPRFGIMRGREFIMKDAYSFDCNEEGTKKSYKKMYNAYINIFRKCGLEARAVEADTGNIGGSFSHEFMIMCGSGEDEIACCSSCDYAANTEKAEYGIDDRLSSFKETLSEELTLIDTPDLRSIEQLSSHLNIDKSRFIKTILFQTEKETIAVLVRGDHEVSIQKLKRVLGCHVIRMADNKKIEEVTGAPAGFSGPVGLKDIPIYVDHSVKHIKNAVTGANKKDMHYKNTNIERDFSIKNYSALRKVVNGDRCPRCSGRLAINRGIEVGHIFILGDKYSKKLGASYIDAEGNARFMSMGCYGIGVGRTVAASIEQNHDENGIIWPIPLAPFKVIIITLITKDGNIQDISNKIYSSLTSSGIETLIDDRDERPGIKFKDADLLGIPFQVIIGKRCLNENKVEIKKRGTGEKILISAEKTAEVIREYIG